MGAVNDTATLYDAQVAAAMPPRLVRMMDLSGADYAMGQLHVLYSELASFVAGGASGDTIQFMKLPPGTLIVGGQLYIENGLGGDNEDADLGVIYEDGDGTDDPNALLDNIDIFDGADMTAGQVAALPTGFVYLIGGEVPLVPYKVTGGWGTITLTSTEAALVTAKDVKLVLYVILPA